jgi:hypothetical protein
MYTVYTQNELIFKFIFYIYKFSICIKLIVNLYIKIKNLIYLLNFAI